MNTNISKAQRQLDGELLLKPDTQALLYRTVHELRQRALQQEEPDSELLRALFALHEALGDYQGDLPSVNEMLGDPQRERLARNLLRG